MSFDFTHNVLFDLLLTLKVLIRILISIYVVIFWETAVSFFFWFCYSCHPIFFLSHSSVAHLTQEPEVPGSIPGPATYYRFSFRLVKKDSCQLLAKVCARSTG